MTDVKYSIQTISKDVINVSRDTFEDYIYILEKSNPNYEIKTLEHDLGFWILKQKTYFIYVKGERIFACQIDTWEDKME